MIAIVLGAVFLILMGIIDLRIPGTYIVTFVVFIVLFGGRGFDFDFIAAHLAGGGLMLGAFFMATDYVTSPVTKPGRIIYGIGCGVVTVMIRYFGGYNEGVSYAILVMNACVVLLDRIGRPVKFGAPKKEAAK